MMELIEFYGAGTIAIIGIIEWLKQLEIKNFKKFTPYVSLVLCIVAGFFAAKSNAKLDGEIDTIETVAGVRSGVTEMSNNNSVSSGPRT